MKFWINDEGTLCVTDDDNHNHRLVWANGERCIINAINPPFQSDESGLVTEHCISDLSHKYDIVKPYSMLVIYYRHTLAQEEMLREARDLIYQYTEGRNSPPADVDLFHRINAALRSGKGGENGPLIQGRSGGHAV